MADLKAQIAANEKGVQELRKMVDQFGLDVVQAYMRHVQDNAEESVRRVITRLKDGAFTLPLDNGAQIRWRRPRRCGQPQRHHRLHRHQPQQTNNFNAPTAVCMAAVLYVFRTLVDDDIPLNAGCLKPCTSSSRPAHAEPEPAGLGGGGQRGNLHLHHQRAVRRAGRDGRPASHDEQLHLRQCALPVLRDHFGRQRARAACSMRRALTGGFDGTSVVQTHMTNSRLTDPEVLEFRFPVRLESYEIRQGSGGAGRWTGGDGGVRRVRFLEPMTASILSNGRVHPALRHGRWPERRAVGINRVVRADGRVEALAHIGSAEMLPGDVFEIRFTTLPVKAMVAALRDAGCPAELSNSAGTFVCNHVFYGLQHALRRRPSARSGFLHLPLLPSQAQRGEPSLPLATMVESVALALDVAWETPVDRAVTEGRLD
jgi:5-oxoprolinase (ATP-hydrolysing)